MVLNKFFIKNNKVTFLILANLTQKLFTFSAFALISKLLTKNEYGKYVYYILIIGFVLELVNAGLFQGIQNDISKKKELHFECKQSIDAAFTFNLLLSLLSFFIVFIFYFINLNKSENIFVIVVFLIFILTSSLNSLSNIVFIALQKSKLFLSSVIIQGFFLFFFLFPIFYLNIQSAVLILFAFCLSYFFSNLFQFFKLRPKFNINHNQLINLFNKGKWYILWSLVSVLESRTDIYLLSTLSDFSQIAVFDIASKYMIIGQVITTILSQKFMPELLSNSNDFEISKKLKKVSFFLIPILVVLIIPISIFIKLFYSGLYDDSIFCYIILTIALIFNMLNINNTSKIILNNNEKYLFIISFLIFIVKIPIALFFISNFNVIGAAISTSLIQIIAFYSFFIFTKKYLSIGKI